MHRLRGADARTLFSRAYRGAVARGRRVCLLALSGPSGAWSECPFDPKRTFGGPTVMSLLTLGGLRAGDFTIRPACEKTSPFDVQRAGPTHRDTWRKFDRRVP